MPPNGWRQRHYAPTRLTRSQLFEDPNASPKHKITERARSWGMLPSSQHLKGVEGCAGAPGWD
jgi:hypothetical protein